MFSGPASPPVIVLHGGPGADYRSLNFRRGVEQFGGEVLFMAGACSTTLGEAQQRRHMAHFRKARLEVLAQAGHNLFRDQPLQALQIVRRYLAADPVQTLNTF